ncbi:MAG TPA: serine hydrolase [Blastocatellia bacterium]|nr:serine hydrolase [Blastocatellia bacterium]
MSKVILSLILAFACSVPALSQGTSDQTLDAAARQRVIDGAIKALNDFYVFPETAKKMEAALRERMQRKEYDNITSPSAFASALTTHLQEVSHDKHLRVFYANGDGPLHGPDSDPGARQRYREMAARRNFSFEKVERLSGNIGYLDLRGFEDPELAAETASAAMTFLANTDALIVDLRQNGGGDPAMVALLSSYLFDKRTHLNDIYSRPDNRTEEFWTKESVPGRKFGGDKPVYVLTSRRTFSGAEEFTYNLKNLKRATIIGEVTGGGAHPVQPHRLSDQFVIGVPFARAINPITKTNWEGTGVQPDIAVPAAQALKTAHLLALKEAQKKITDPRLAEQIRNIIAVTQSELDEMKKSATTQTPATPAATQELALPNTPAGKTLGEFIKAFNTGNADTLKRFHREHGGDDGNAEEDMGFYNQSGGLKLHSVVRSAETEIEVLVQAKKDGRWLKFSIEVSPAPPHGINGIRVQPASAPAEKSSSYAAPPETAPASAPNRKLSEAEMVSELDSFLTQQTAEDKFSGAVLIAKDGRTLFKKAYGVASRTTKAPNRTDTKFNLGSMNKMFTAVAIAQLAEQGKLSFEDKVGKYLPDYPNKDVAAKVTIHHLLTHTSGLGSYWNKKFDERRRSIRTVNDYLALFADEPLRFEPGARFDYSNSGFIVLGAIIEKVSGQSYYDYVREHIFRPAGMTNTDCYEMTGQVENLAMGYTTGDDERPASGPRHENTDTRPNRGGPAGGGYSTVEDLLKFSQALRAHKLLSQKSTELITTAKVPMGPNGGYGYGFGDLKMNGLRFYGHNGGAPGIAAELRIFPDSGYVIAAMSNYDPPTLMPVVRRITTMIANIQ